MYSSSSSSTPSSSSSTPAGGVTHEDIAPQALKPAATPGASVFTAVLAAAAYCYGKAMGDEHTKSPRHVLAALRVVPSLVLMFTTLSAPGNRTYAAAVKWGLLLCAVGDALIELDPTYRWFYRGHLVRLLYFGLAFFMSAHVAYARAFASDMPASSLRITGPLACCHRLAPGSINQPETFPTAAALIGNQPPFPIYTHTHIHTHTHTHTQAHTSGDQPSASFSTAPPSSASSSHSPSPASAPSCSASWTGSASG
jgi:hypothetical protein